MCIIECELRSLTNTICYYKLLLFATIVSVCGIREREGVHVIYLINISNWSDVIIVLIIFVIELSRPAHKTTCLKLILLFIANI